MRQNMRQKTSWQRMIGMLVAILIGTLVFGQAAEAFTCIGGDAVVEAGVTADAVNSGEKDSPAKQDVAGVCQHGHCHQSLRLIEPAAILELPMLTAVAPVSGRDAAIADGQVYTIDYPPRA
jgi:hypothetical protein